MQQPAPITQADHWNGAAGQAWVAEQETLDIMFQPVEDLLVDLARAHGGRRVLDIGCGTGATTIALAAATGADCTGIDISAPMLAVARDRAAARGVPARFVHADAQTHAFAPGSADLLVSRFGVMFFPDPVRAFANLRTAARDGADLRCIAWRAASETPFMTAAERAVADLLPPFPTRPAGSPGQFSFADPARVTDILTASGWTDVRLDPLDIVCTIPAARLTGYLTRLGAVGLALQRMAPGARGPVVAALQAAFAPYVTGDEARYTAACWRVSARAGA